MSHRENSLMPWITDASVREAKHADCVKRTGHHCIILSPYLYRAAEEAGLDMRDYVMAFLMPTHGEVLTIDHPMPTSAQMRDAVRDKLAKGEPLGASHVPEIKPGVYANGSSIECSPFAPSTKARWMGCPPARKHITERTCHGKEVACLPGLNGHCTACFDDD
jgi:hypothetical protein